MSCVSFLPCLPAFDQLARPLSLRHHAAQLTHLATFLIPCASAARCGQTLRFLYESSDLAMFWRGRAILQQALGSA